jgi:hypothetical protein
MIDIDNKEILQINTALIAGALIFLTLSSIATTPEGRWYNVILDCIWYRNNNILFSIFIDGNQGK